MLRSKAPPLGRILSPLLSGQLSYCSPGLFIRYPHYQQRCQISIADQRQHQTLVDRTTIPSDVKPGGIEGQQPRQPPSAVKPEKPRRESDKESPQTGQAAAPPPFNPMDPEAKKRSRVAQWGDEPPRRRRAGPDEREGDKIQLNDASLAVQFMDKLRGCTVSPEVKRDGTIRFEMLKLMQSQRFSVPLVSQLVTDYREGMTAAIQRLSSVFESFDDTGLNDCCSDALCENILAVLDELRQADAKLVIEIEKISSGQLLAVNVITADGNRHDTLVGDFPYFNLIKAESVVEFEGFVEIVQKVFIEERTTNKVLYGAKDSITAFHKMKFSASLSPVFPVMPKSWEEFKSWYKELGAMPTSEVWKAARNPFTVSPWTLLNIDETVEPPKKPAEQK